MNRRLVAALLLALILRVVAALAFDGRTISSDEVHWQRMAEYLWRGGLLSAEAGFFRPPLYPLAMSMVYEVFGNEPLAVRLLQAAASAAVCWVPYALARAACGPMAGLCAALLAACYPLFVFFSGVLMAETLLLGCVAAALWQVQRLLMQPGLARAVGLGMTLGMGALCKPVILAWLPFLAAILWVKIALPISSKLIHLAVLAAALVFCVAPWTLRNFQVSGRVVPISTNVGINLLVGHEKDAMGSYRDGADYWGMMEEISDFEADPVRRDAVVAERMFARIAADPLRALRLAAKKVVLLWSPLLPDASPLHFFAALLTSGPVLLMGMLGLWQLRGDALAWSAASLAIALTCVHALFFAHTRFRLPIDLALIAPAACWMAMHLPRGKCDEPV